MNSTDQASATIQLQAQPASMTATIEIKRAATGLVERHQVKLVPAPTPAPSNPDKKEI